MNNFIFENGTKVYFGKGCVKEFKSLWKKRYACLWWRGYQAKRCL